ncbi:MAG: hypothetical protein JWN70_4552 [Planctomycetaceae bacterium]|nr:hypothetical protein [Planctomycetaceae bacterium]
MPIDSDSELLEGLLQFDLQHFASVLGFAPAPAPLSNAAATALLNLAERCSRKADDSSRRICLTICGLISEYRRIEWAAAPAFIVNLLSRIGLAPSMRMADPTYRKTDDTFASLGSFATEIAVVARCMRSEVTTGGSTLLLSDFQHRVWNLIDGHRRVGISAPTSAGKSHVLVHKVLDILWKCPGTAVFVVPTISLIHQVTRDLRAAASQLGIKDIGVYQSYIDGVETRHSTTVFVLTQERALSAFAQPAALKGCRIVVIDEVQNIERVSEQNDERAHSLLEVVHEFETGRQVDKIIISGPRIENIGQLASDLFGRAAMTATAELPPVVNITYTFSESGPTRKRKTVLNQYVEVSDKVRSLELVDAEKIRTTVFTKQQYSAGIHDIMGQLVKNLSAGHGTLVFSPTSDQATETAIELAKRIQLTSEEHVPSLIQYVAETVHEKYAIVNTLKKGIGFHHGKMPQHIRIAVEYAFSQQYVGLIVCTTTLMQGINLPAKNLIARNPNLFLKRGENAPILTPYEFANLRGRAGRLMQDFVGRSLILDESFFLDVKEYVSSPGTQVASGYEARFGKFRKEIISQLLTDELLVGERIAGDLVTYIRHTVFRYNEGALPRLRRVGITISDEEFAKIASMVNKLKVSRDVVERNPTWDPLDLETIHTAHLAKQFRSIPKTPFAENFVSDIVSVVEVVAKLVPLYFLRYLGDVPVKYLRGMAISAQSWSAEKPLKEIIGWLPPDGDVTWEIIDQRLAILLNAVIYNLPKLLRPLAMMQDVDNPLLGFIELGAFRPVSRRLIELGLPRETAIRCCAKFSPALNSSMGDPELIKASAVAAEGLTHWDRLQVDELK